MYNDRTAQKADTLTLKIILSVDSSVCVEKKHEKALATTTKTKTTCKINSKQNRDYFLLFVLRGSCRGRLHAPRAHQTDNNAAEEILEDEGFTVLCHFGRENRKCC